MRWSEPIHASDLRVFDQILDPQVRGSSPRCPQIYLHFAAIGRRVGANLGRIDLMTTRLVRLFDIAELLGVSHHRTSVIARKTGFPRPVGREDQSMGWDRREVTALAKERRREKPWRYPIVNPTRKATTIANGSTQGSVIRIFLGRIQRYAARSPGASP